MATNENIDSAERFPLTGNMLLELTENQPRLLGFLLKRLGNLDQARDVLQEVNLVICRRAAEFEEGTSFTAWAFAIARYELLAYRKRQSRERLVFSADMASQLDAMDESLFANDVGDLRQAALKLCMRLLTSEQQELILQRYGESLSVKSIAGEIGKTPNAVSLMLHRIREQLMDCIERRLPGLQNE